MKTRIVLLLAAACALAGCALSRSTGMVTPPLGIIYTHYKAPIVIDLNETPAGEDKGALGTHYIREPFLGTSYAWGDASTDSASREGNLSRVDYIDYEYFQILGIYSKYSIRAHGKE